MPEKSLGDLLLEAVVPIKKDLTYGELVVTTWKACPRRFSLDGFNLPDSHRVSSTLYGQRGLVHQGFLEKVKDKYRVTELGKRRVTPRPPPKQEPNPEKPPPMPEVKKGTSFLEPSEQEKILYFGLNGEPRRQEAVLRWMKRTRMSAQEAVMAFDEVKRQYR